MDILQIVITAFCSVLASSGFWAYMQKKSDDKDLKSQMLIGLGHDRICHLGISYLQRKDINGEAYITKDEYENLHDYLYTPYLKLGGNGSAERIMEEVKKLPIHDPKIKETYNERQNL